MMRIIIRIIIIIIIMRLPVVMVQQHMAMDQPTQTKMSVLVNLKPLIPNAKQTRLPSIFASYRQSLLVPVRNDIPLYSSCSDIGFISYILKNIAKLFEDS